MNGNLSVPSPSQLLETVFKKWHEEAVHTRESYSKTSGVADKKSLKWYSERIQQYEALCEGLREIKIKVRYLDFVGAGMEHGRSIERADTCQVDIEVSYEVVRILSEVIGHSEPIGDHFGGTLELKRPHMSTVEVVAWDVALSRSHGIHLNLSGGSVLFPKNLSM